MAYFPIWAGHTFWTLTLMSNAEDNPFAAPKQQPVGKVRVYLPIGDWLCRKMDGLNLTHKDHYLSRSSETGGLQRDPFVKHSKSDAKWYVRLHPNQDRPASSVSFWHSDSAKLNSAYSHTARSVGLTSPSPSSSTLSQDTQTLGEGCKVQQGMQMQLRNLQSEKAKGKSDGKVGAATEELHYLMNFSTSITQCVAKAMEHLSDFTFVSMANVTVCRRDS